MKKINLELSESSIDNLILKFKNMQKDFEQANSNIVKDMAEFTEEKISQNLSNTPYKDGNDRTQSYKDIRKTSAKVGMRGSQSAYNEFGTGTIGQKSPHPMKGQFGLNGYNTGKTIRRNKSKSSSATENGIPINGKYWTYNGPNGKVYTQGIPAGKQVYNAVKTLKRKKREIIKKRVGEVLSKL